MIRKANVGWSLFLHSPQLSLKVHNFSTFVVVESLLSLSLCSVQTLQRPFTERKKKKEEFLLASRQQELCRMVLVSNSLCVGRLTLSGSISVSSITWSTEDTLWWILCLETFGDTLYLYSVKLGQLLCWDNPSGSSTIHLKIARKAWVLCWLV